MRLTVAVLALAGVSAAAETHPRLSSNSPPGVSAAGKNIRGLSTRQSCSSILDECGSGCMDNDGECCDDILGEYCPDGEYCVTGGCCEDGEICYGISDDDEDDDNDYDYDDDDDGDSSTLCRRKGRGGGGGGDDECDDAPGVHIPALLIGLAALVPILI
ncbi:hypothetical protein ACO1O0_002414 [Amphichorda felina]